MKSVVVTGGSEGLGLAIAKAYGKAGLCVVLAARKEDKLKRAATELARMGIKTEICSVDLGNETGPAYLFSKYPDADILVNGAGIGRLGEVLKGSSEKDNNMLDLNCRSVMALCCLYGKAMCERGSGLIVNIASTGAFQPGPYTALYYATKSFVLSYSRALTEEWKDKGVHVSCVCPGPIDTAFYAKSGGKVPWYAAKPDHIAEYVITKAPKKAVVICGLRDRLLLCIPTLIRMYFVKQDKQRILKKIAQEDQKTIEDII